MSSAKQDLNPWVHDPSGQAMDYTLPIPVKAGDVVSSATITPVDDNDMALTGDSLTITNVSTGVIDDTHYGVTFLATGGTPGTVYKLRCRYTLAGSPPRGSDLTVRLRCDNT